MWVRAARAARYAQIDPLTGLLNRRGLLTRAEQLMAGAPLRAQIACVVIDIDRFKSINDTFGHDVGDKVLVAVADALGAVLDDMMFLPACPHL